MVVVLHRGTVSVEMTRLTWDALQVFAQKAGWHPAGAVAMGDRTQSLYMSGCVVSNSDALNLANALHRFINTEPADSLDLAPIVGLVNFLRGGSFEIR